MLDHAVFQAVERHDHQPALRTENIECRFQAPLQLAQLVIHMDAQGLECAGRGMDGKAQKFQIWDADRYAPIEAEAIARLKARMERARGGEAS